MVDRDNLTPFFRNHTWLIPPIALGIILVSPIVLPIKIFCDSWKDLKDFYIDSFDLLFLRFSDRRK